MSRLPTPLSEGAIAFTIDRTCVEPTAHGQQRSRFSRTGELWLLIGTDSGFEGLTRIYYQRIDVTLAPINPRPDPVLLSRNTTFAATLDSAILTTDPYPVIPTRNFFSSDPHTHITLFAYNLELRQGENVSAITVGAQDEQGVIYVLPVVAVHEVPNFSWIKQVTVKLPDQLKGVERVLVWIRLHTHESNKGVVTIRESIESSF